MKTIKGKIRSLNVSPKGFPESFLLENGKGVVQINFLREAGPEGAKGLSVGDEVTLSTKEIEDHRPSHHPVYEWEGAEPGPEKGVVKAINYARHGEPNGAILESGEFLHMRPEGVKSVNIALGQSLSFQGERRIFPSGQAVIEARVVNGIALDRHPKPPTKKHAAKHR